MVAVVIDGAVSTAAPSVVDVAIVVDVVVGVDVVVVVADELELDVAVATLLPPLLQLATTTSTNPVPIHPRMRGR
jgi:hypothetical protein